MANACHFAGQLLAAQQNSRNVLQATAPVFPAKASIRQPRRRLAVHDLRAVTRLTGPVADRSDSV